MSVELRCGRCACEFSTPKKRFSYEPTFHEETWYDLGDGNTLEDSIHGALDNDLACPACGEALAMSEQQLGDLAMAMLAAF